MCAAVATGEYVDYALPLSPFPETLVQCIIEHLVAEMCGVQWWVQKAGIIGSPAIVVNVVLVQATGQRIHRVAAKNRCQNIISYQTGPGCHAGSAHAIAIDVDDTNGGKSCERA